MSTAVYAPAKGMTWVPGGTFAMGSEHFYPEEHPVRPVAVEGFWIDRSPVTVAQFRRFVTETRYVTVAERPLDPADYPGVEPAALVPGSLVFHKTPGPVDLRDVRSEPAGTARRGPARARPDATAIRSPTSPTRTPRRTRRGPARSFRPRPSGSARRAAAWRARSSRGGTSWRPKAG
jgi:formylglycine-generating enzyme required for sulfatase activity